MTTWTPPLPPELPLDAHKGVAGRVLLACGSAWMPGAAILAARAAQRAGAGLVAVLIIDDVLRSVLPVAAPEAVLEDPGSVSFESDKWHAGLVGPGLGLTQQSQRLFERMHADFTAPLVIDGDALTMLARATKRDARKRTTVLTPHAGEAARLLGRDMPSDDPGRIAAAREISAKYGAICCLKGHRTVVAEGERVYVNDTGNPGLATAGSGDVLAGICTAWLALVTTLPRSSFSPFDAAASAVRVHGRAGDLARDRLGARAVIASDIVDALPDAQRP
jgi:ADP-dependent NAD(P)H-hydrate dehydratase